MKTSTKNVIITGIFSIVTCVLGLIAGNNIQNNKVESAINQSGAITINNNEKLTDTIERLLDEYTKLQDDFNSLSIDYTKLQNDYSVLISEKEELLNKINTLEENSFINNKSSEENITKIDEMSDMTTDKYLFDEAPFMIEHVNLLMRNNDRNTIYKSGSFLYDTGFRMQSNGEEYEKGMSITPKSNNQAIIYYNLHGEYNNLTGSIAFEDKFSERIDKNYDILFYKDDIFIQKITISKGVLAEKFNIDISNCQILKIMLEKPEGDKSDNPNINLIEFELHK